MYRFRFNYCDKYIPSIDIIFESQNLSQSFSIILNVRQNFKSILPYKYIIVNYKYCTNNYFSFITYVIYNLVI